MVPTLAAEPIFSGITNSLLTTSMVTLGFVGFAFYFKKSLAQVGHTSNPRGIVNLMEWLTETLYSYFDQVTGARAKTIQFTPLIASVFLFILIVNWVGLLPGVGSIGFWHGKELIPLFRAGTSDLNLTFGMAIVTVLTSHILGVVMIGFWSYFNKFIKISDIVKAFRKPTLVGIFSSFVEFGVGILEIFSEIAKVVSLGLRLFGNIFAGEVLLSVIALLGKYLLPIPFMGLEILVGLVQATVFSMLALTYISISTTNHHDSGH